MKKFLVLLVAFIMLFVFCACGGRSANKEAINPGGADYAADAMDPGYKSEASDMESDGLADSIGQVDSPIYTDPNAKIIRTAKLTIQTLDFDKAVSDLAALTESLGGYYETSQIESGSYYNQQACRSAYYIVRIPKEKFAEFRNAVSSVGHIYNFSESADNVGEEYYDIEMRLATLKTKHARLLELLEKAEILEDVITLENALSEVEYEIDKYSSTLQKYDGLIDYSTFTINLDEVVEIKEDPGPQEGFGTKLLAQLEDGFSEFVAALESFAFFIARNIITLIMIAAVVAIVTKVFLAKRKRNRSKNMNA